MFSACAKANLACSSSSFFLFISVFASFSLSHLLLKSASCSFIVTSFSSISSILFLLISSFSFFKACLSISRLIIFLVSSSSSTGIDSSCILIVAQASSTKSMALSGKNLSVIYLSDKVAAETKALSFIVTPWNISNLSFNPRRIVIVSVTFGSLTKTFWNLLSRAPSFSIYLRYSFRVVAPITWISPRASIGFNILETSMAPSVPEPTIMWISSLISFKTAFNLSSNSPRYLAPATKAPKSSSQIVLFFKELGMSPFIILWARPSTMAVLPTPGSPIKTGLFLLLRDNILTTFLISSSLPITGSTLLSKTFLVISRPYLFKTSFNSSLFSKFILITLS